MSSLLGNLSSFNTRDVHKSTHLCNIVAPKSACLCVQRKTHARTHALFFGLLEIIGVVHFKLLFQGTSCFPVSQGTGACQPSLGIVHIRTACSSSHSLQTRRSIVGTRIQPERAFLKRRCPVKTGALERKHGMTAVCCKSASNFSLL